MAYTLPATTARYVQMDGHPPRPQVVHTQHAANDISAQIIKDQHFPNRIAILVQNWCRLRDQALGGCIMMSFFREGRIVV